MKKLNVKWALVIAMLTFMAACLFSDKIQREVSANEEIPVEDITPYKTPTGDVRKFLGMWMTSGYNLQPQPNNYTVVDSPTTLRTDSGRSLWTAITSLFAPAHYQWYETTDGTKWTEVSKKKCGTKKNLTITPKENSKK